MLKSNVPKDVVIEILSRLPAETLVRFKLVHKSWYALLESSQFVAMQLQNHVRCHSSNNDNNLYLLVKSQKPTSTGVERTILSLLTYDDRRQATSNEDDVSFVLRNVDLPLHGECGFWISGQCDGIICLYNLARASNCTIIIANLGIREFRALHDSCIPVPIEDYGGRPEPCYSETIGVGFGFDSKTNDYKIVRILQFNSLYNSPVGNPRAEVYSLKSNSWRQIECIDDDCGPVVFWSAAEPSSSYWNGVYYWPAEHFQGLNNHRVCGMASFDFSDEEFQFIAFPEHLSLTLKDWSEFGILMFHGTHALIIYPMDNCFDIWMMDEVGISGTWTKLLSIGPLLGLRRPLAFGKSNEILLLLSDGQVTSYNIDTNQMKNLLILDSELFAEVMTYKSSLVSIN